MQLDYQNKGSLFTLFLTTPAFAFCFVCHLNDLTNEQWTLCQDNVQKIIVEIIKIFLKSKLVGKIRLEISFFERKIYLVFVL